MQLLHSFVNVIPERWETYHSTLRACSLFGTGIGEVGAGTLGVALTQSTHRVDTSQP
jgi:hypothetical protein